MTEPVQFPDIPLFQGWSTPHRIESDIRNLETISGKIPEDLNGSLYRCGPDRQYPSMSEHETFIDGEGMVHRFKFENGNIDYRSRWVRNERFLLQEKARRSLFGRYRNRYTNDPSVAGKNQGTANTNVIWHGNKLQILKEDSLPIEVNPDTFEVIGEHNYAGALNSVSLSAHPKMDYHLNELLTFSYQAQGDGTTDFVFYIINADGEVDHSLEFTMPYAAMVHDFAITDTHIIVPFFPLITDMDVVKEGGPYFQWHPDEETVCAIFPRRGKAEELRWFKGPPTSAGHMMNAFNEDGYLHLDLCLYEGNCFPFFPAADGSKHKMCPPLLTRMSFNLESDESTFSKTLLGETFCEMPQIDERYNGKKYRHGFTICYAPPRRTSLLGHWDLEKDTLTTYSFGEDTSIQEAKFVTRHIGADEADGYLLVLVNHVTEMRSELAIMNALDIEAGPIAVVKVPTRVRATFHGSWVPQSALETGLYQT